MVSSKKLLSTINKQFGTLPFCRRYLDRLGEKSYLLAVRSFPDPGLGFLCEGSLTLPR